MAEGTVRIAQMFDRFQKAAASKGILEQQLTKETAELNRIDAEVAAGLASLGYVATEGGPTPAEFVTQAMAAIEAELTQFEAAV